VSSLKYLPSGDTDSEMPLSASETDVALVVAEANSTKVMSERVRIISEVAKGRTQALARTVHFSRTRLQFNMRNFLGEMTQAKCLKSCNLPRNQTCRN